MPAAATAEGVYYRPRLELQSQGLPYRDTRCDPTSSTAPERTLACALRQGTREDSSGGSRNLSLRKARPGDPHALGQIDLLWWDGWDCPTSITTPRLDARPQLQPGLVTNDRLRLWSERPRLATRTEFRDRNPPSAPGPGSSAKPSRRLDWRGEKAACNRPRTSWNAGANRAWAATICRISPAPRRAMAPSYYAIMEQWPNGCP